MAEQEGVIKFSLQHSNEAYTGAEALCDELIVWRNLCRRLGFLGQVPDRYQGYGYGNISARVNENAFLISASQTSGILEATSEHIAMVSSVNIAQNSLISKGMLPPSSESMTHAALFQFDDNINWIIHSHCPEIWQCSDQLGLPFTEHDVPYGTPEMAYAVQSLCGTMPSKSSGVFVMKGHEDGVVSYASSALEAMQLMQNTYADALFVIR